MAEKTNDIIQQHIAQLVKDACIEAALVGFDHASMSGLCYEGACEAAISAIRNVDLENILKKISSS